MLTPMDIVEKEFSKSLNGYNKNEVEEYLNKISEQLEAMIRESDYLKSQMTQADRKLTDYQAQENSLKDALLVAQITSNDIKKKAELEAERMIKDAEAEANKIMRLADEEAKNTIEKAKADADRNIENAKKDYLEIETATGELKKDYLSFKEKYQYVLREQIQILDQINIEE